MNYTLVIAAVLVGFLLVGCHHLDVEADAPEGLLEPHVHIDFSALEIHKE